MGKAKGKFVGKLKKDEKEDQDSRILIMSSEVDSDSVKDIIQEILEINAEDDKSLKKAGFVRQPIKLIINSYGGSVYDGFGLIDVMEGSKTPVHTYVYGSAMSMGLVISVCGHRRFAGKLATFMYHESSYGTSGKVQTHIEDLKETQRIDEVGDGILNRKTKIPKRLMTAAKNKKTDWYFDAAAALKYGVVDEIL